jgi:hypothetical protein
VLPYLEVIQRSFGEHDVSQVKAHTDSQAAAGAGAMGAEAFTAGEHVAFAGTPTLHTAAHEAAHVVQQRGGVRLKGGVGQAGDAYEQHADAVADAVVRGESAEALLDEARGERRPEGRRGSRRTNGAPGAQLTLEDMARGDGAERVNGDPVVQRQVTTALQSHIPPSSPATDRVSTLLAQYQATQDLHQRERIAGQILAEVDRLIADPAVDATVRSKLASYEGPLRNALAMKPRDPYGRAAAVAGGIVVAGGGPEDLPADAIAAIFALGILVLEFTRPKPKIEPQQIDEILDRIRESVRPREQPGKGPEKEPAPKPGPLVDPIPNPDRNDRKRQDIVYRGMIDDGSGPKVEQSARGLGVRVLGTAGDVRVVGGIVQADGGGMSVAPDTPTNLPEHRRPPEWGGTGKDPVWAIPTAAFVTPLQYIRDTPTHGTVSVAMPTPLAAMQAALAATRPVWQRVPGPGRKGD